VKSKRPSGVQDGKPGAREGLLRGGAWYADPYGKAAERWWDGHGWTFEVRGAPTPQDAHRVPRAEGAGAARTRLSGQTRAEPKSKRTAVCPSCLGTGSSGLGFPCAICAGTGRASARERSVFWILFAITVVVVGVPLLARLF
jgi:hypothetical protein